MFLPAGAPAEATKTLRGKPTKETTEVTYEVTYDKGEKIDT